MVLNQEEHTIDFVRKILLTLLSLLLLSSCSLGKPSTPLMKDFTLKASDFGIEYIVPEDSGSSILSIFNIDEELSCYYGKNYANASAPSVLSNSLQSPSVQLFKSRVDQFKSPAMASRYFSILSSAKGSKCFEGNYKEKLATSLEQSGAKLQDLTTIKEIKKGNSFIYRTITVTIAPSDSSPMPQDYKVAFYYNLIGNKVFTSVLAYSEESKVEQIASSLPSALKNAL